jgi:hypothetical protein
MATAFQSITNTSAATKITYNYNGWDSMIFTNIHASSPVVMSLYIIAQDSAGEPTGSILAYFLRNVKIPAGVSLRLEEDEFSYDNSKYLLYATIDVNGITVTARRK